MKKLFVLAALMMATITASAQFEPGTFSIQPRVGITASMISNMPKLNFDEAYVTLDKQPAVGLMAGVDLEYQINEMFSFSAGVNYAMQGSGWEDYKWSYRGSTAEITDLKIEADYLNVPVTLNCYIVAGLSVRTGVQFGFLTNAKEKGDYRLSGGSSTDYKLEIDKDVKDMFEKFDVSIPVGISYEFPNHLVIDTRYNIGLTKVFKENFISEKNGKNQVFTLTLGYKIPL